MQEMHDEMAEAATPEEQLPTTPEPQETPPITPVAEPVAESPSEEELESRRLAAESEARFREVLTGTLNLAVKEFAEAIAQATLKELTLLMEVIAAEPLTRNRLRIALPLKKRFDEFYSLTLERLREVRPDDVEGQQEKQETSDLSFRFSEAYGKFNRVKGSFEEDDRKAREGNTEAKEALLKELREIVLQEDPKLAGRVKNIQTKWKDIGPVVPHKAELIYESFKALMDQFYSLRSNYMDLVDQDRKVNLEAKQALVAELQKLGQPAEAEAADADYWTRATDRVNHLHEQWKATGPAPRKEADNIWEAFKAATNQFYDVRRTYYAGREELRERNQDVKQQMLDQLLLYASFGSEDVTAWQKATDEIKVLQEQWFAQGPAPKEVNTELNRKFKSLVNDFFNAKSAFFKGLDSQRDALLKKKEELADQADALQNSEDWEKTVDTLKRLQAEWKKTGIDTFKEARKAQKRFRSACDNFFTRLKNRHKAALEQEEANLTLKQAELARLDALIAERTPAEEGTRLDEEARAALKTEAEAIKAAYDAIGEVPRRAFGKLSGQWQAAWNRYLALTVDDPKRLETIQQESKFLALKNEKGDEALDREFKRLQRMIRELADEINQYQNNILFIQKGKKGDGLRAEIQQKIERAEKQKQRLEKELKALKQVTR